MAFSFAAPSAVASGAWVVGATDGSKLLPGASDADKATGGALTRALRASRFTGKQGQILEILAPSGTKASRVILVGLGKPDECDGSKIENATAGALGRVGNSGETAVTFQLDVPSGAKLRAADLAAHIAFA